MSLQRKKGEHCILSLAPVESGNKLCLIYERLFEDF